LWRCLPTAFLSTFVWEPALHSICHGERRQPMHELLAQSLSIIASGQSASGAYIASPTYPTYNYCWFRDGTLITYAMVLCQKHESARRFYDWATAAVAARADAVERCLEDIE